MTPILGIMASSISGSKAITGAYESIASATGTGSSGTIVFSSIPSTYASLQLRIIGRHQANTDPGPIQLFVRVNADTTSTIPYHWLDGDGTSATAVGDNTATQMRIGLLSNANYSANNMGVTILDIHDYTSTTRNKTFRSFSGVDNNDTTQGATRLSSGVWLNTAAITSLTFSTNAGANFTTSTQFALYGIKGA